MGRYREWIINLWILVLSIHGFWSLTWTLRGDASWKLNGFNVPERENFSRISLLILWSVILIAGFPLILTCVYINFLFSTYFFLIFSFIYLSYIHDYFKNSFFFFRIVFFSCPDSSNFEKNERKRGRFIAKKKWEKKAFGNSSSDRCKL